MSQQSTKEVLRQLPIGTYLTGVVLSSVQDKVVLWPIIDCWSKTLHIEGSSVCGSYWKLSIHLRFHSTFFLESFETNGLRLVPPLGNLLLLRHVYSACVVTIMLRSITCMVYGGGLEACHQDLYDPTGEQGLDGFDGFDC